MRVLRAFLFPFASEICQDGFGVLFRSTEEDGCTELGDERRFSGEFVDESRRSLTDEMSRQRMWRDFSFDSFDWFAEPYCSRYSI